MNRRGEIIQYVTQKYGREQVAQIITFNTLGARAAIKDVGRVLEVPFADVERLTKMVPATLNISLQEAFDQEPGFNEAAKKDSRIDDVMKVALRLEGLARNCSVHAAGVVISRCPCAIWFRCTRPTGTKLSPSSIWAGWKNSSCSRWIFWG
jgi:DNA polymerase-3 subunit alpha